MKNKDKIKINKNKIKKGQGSGFQKEFTKCLGRLKKARKECIEAEIEAETGPWGVLRKLGIPLLAKARGKIPAFLNKKDIYHKELDEFRKIVIIKFKTNSRNLFKDSLNSLYQITVEDEIRRYKIEKEEKLRSKGMRGFIRERFQEYREVMPAFKMVSGYLFIISGTILYFSTPEQYLIFQFSLITLGMMMGLEGLQQESTFRKGIRLGLSRSQVFRSAKRQFETKSGDLADKLDQSHRYLEDKIWDIRLYEKRAEYSRYIFSIIGGAIIGALAILPAGFVFALDTFIIAGSAHLLIYILIPFGIIKHFLLRKTNKYYSVEYYPKEDSFLSFESFVSVP